MTTLTLSPDSGYVPPASYENFPPRPEDKVSVSGDIMTGSLGVGHQEGQSIASSTRLDVVPVHDPNFGTNTLRMATDNTNASAMRFLAYGTSYVGGSLYSMGANAFALDFPGSVGFQVPAGKKIEFGSNNVRYVQINDTGSLNVNSTATNAKLTVNASTETSASYYTAHFRVSGSTFGASRVLVSQGSTYGFAIAQSGTSGAGGRTDFQYVDVAAGTTLTTPISFNGYGQVGISGANNGNPALQVWQTDKNYGVEVMAATSGTSSGKVSLRLLNSANTVERLSFYGDSDTQSTIAYPSMIRFVQGITERLRIESNGSVGIGVTNPNVIGTLSVLGNNTNSIVVQHPAAGTVAAPSETHVVGSSYSTGIAPAGMYSVNSYSDNFGNWLTFKTTNASGGTGERLRIDASGNVGIGVTNPTYNLQVGGGSFLNPSNATGGFNIHAKVSYDDAVSHTVGSYANAFFVAHIIDGTGVQSIPIMPNAGAGVAYAYTRLDPDAGTWTYAASGVSVSWVAAGTTPNTYSLTIAGGSGSLSIQRTAGTRPYTIAIQLLFAI